LSVIATKTANNVCAPNNTISNHQSICQNQADSVLLQDASSTFYPITWYEQQDKENWMYVLDANTGERRHTAKQGGVTSPSRHRDVQKSIKFKAHVFCSSEIMQQSVSYDIFIASLAQ